MFSPTNTTLNLNAIVQNDKKTLNYERVWMYEMSSKPYPNKTDRSKQFNEFKDYIGWTRKELKFWEHYFFTGELLAEKVEQSTWLLFLHPEQTTERWQYALTNLFDLNNRNRLELRNDELNDKFFFPYLQNAFLGLLNSFFFHPEDRAWIFTQIFGESYDPERKFPLLLPNENECRAFTYTAKEIVSFIFVDINSVLRGKSKDTYAIYIVRYILSLLPYIDLISFGISEPDDDNDYSVWSVLNRAIHFAHQDIGSASDKDQPKIELARKVKSIFDNYEGELGEYQQLVELVEQEGPQV